MKQKFFLVLLLVSCISYSSVAQLTTGKSSANVVRNGNRASEGDFGLYFGTTADVLRKVGNDKFEPVIMPLVNLKYMYSDEIELRLGLELNKCSQKVDGSVEIEENKSQDVSSKLVDVDHAIFPGFAYHFSNTNVLDVYVGAELPLGYKRLSNKQTTGKDYDNATRFNGQVGLGGFIGVQAYIANLPIAVGVEYGIYSMLDFGMKTKYESKRGDNKKQVFYTTDFTGNLAWEDVSARQGEIGNKVRLTLTYFFNK